MLPFRRAVLAAAFILIVLFLISQSHSASKNSPLLVSQQLVDDVEGTYKVPAAPPEQGSRSAPVVDETLQKPLVDLSKLSLREQLEYHYSYDVSSKFPAYIWQTWKSTPADGDFNFREQEASWTVQHPGFIHEVITDKVAIPLLRLLYAGVPDVLEAYHALPMPVLKADFFRYLILFARGGIYSDIDTYAIRSALEWIPANVPRNTIGLVIGIEADPDRPDWKQWYSRRIQFCQWTIQAKSGHPVLLEIIANITENTLRMKRTGELAKFSDRKVVDLTGPAVWTDVIFDYFNNPKFFDMQASTGAIDWRNFTGIETPRKVGDVVVLPITGFSPGVEQMGAKGVDDPMAMVKHEFEGTWKPENERHIGEYQ